MTPREPLLTAAEVAAEVRMDPETIRRWVREGKLTAITLPGGHKRFRREDIEAVLRGEPAGDVA